MKRKRSRGKRRSTADARGYAEAEALAYLEAERRGYAQAAAAARRGREASARGLERARAVVRAAAAELDAFQRALGKAGEHAPRAQRKRLRELGARYTRACGDFARAQKGRDAYAWLAVYCEALADALGSECERRRQAAAGHTAADNSATGEGRQDG